jgi:uncharacterized membrane protein
MHPRLSASIDRWVAAGLLEEAAAERIRTFEARLESERGPRWPTLLAISFGAALLGSGVCLFVASHWDDISPASRFSLVLAMVALFHVAGATLATRFEALATALHAVGTICLGAGIFMAGQIFNLQEHWPGGVMLWALGACLGWILLREWTQPTMAAILTPFWLAGEWIVATDDLRTGELILSESLLLLAVTYLSALTADRPGPVRRALMWIGGMALIPAVMYAWLGPREFHWRQDTLELSGSLRAIGWIVGMGAPLLLAWLMRRRAAWMNLIAALWIVIFGTMAGVTEDQAKTSAFLDLWSRLAPYLWCLVGAVALIAWGLKEARRERINLGVAGFGLTIMAFYFSSVMDKLGRSTSLITLGILFLLGGWLLERGRRRLVARLQESAA